MPFLNERGIKAELDRVVEARIDVLFTGGDPLNIGNGLTPDLLTQTGTPAWNWPQFTVRYRPFDWRHDA